MGETKNTQKLTKSELDHKLKLAAPNRQILEDLAVACAKDPSPDNTFQYAFCLSKSTEPSELRYAVSILDGLVKEGYEHQLDCMYGAACALYLLGEYEKSRVSRGAELAPDTVLVQLVVVALVLHPLTFLCCCVFVNPSIDVNKFFDQIQKVVLQPNCIWPVSSPRTRKMPS